MVLETVQPVLSNYFLNPAGLIALTALLPLAIFYLVRRKPDRKTIPSMMFFRSEEDRDSTSQAFRRLARNLLLLLHIITVIGFTIAFANPYISGSGAPEKSTLVLDQSASMEGDFQNAKDFLLSNLGEENSVILVDDEARLATKEVSEENARNIIQNAELKDTKTDIVSGLEIARRTGGTAVISSDLDQSVNQRDPSNTLENFRTDEIDFKAMETEKRNSWGVTGLEVGEENTTVQIKNFQNQENTVQVSGATDKQITIPGKSIETLNVESRTGKNTVRLEEDSFSADNEAHFYIPDEENFEVVLIADEENPYLMKVFELIDFTSIEYRRPPIEGEVDADLYIIGKTERILSETVQSIESDVRKGGNLVVYGRQDISDLGFSDLPVNDRGGYVNTSVIVSNPSRINLGQMEIRDLEMTRGERYSSASNALIKSDYGEGEALVYNVRDSRFNREFLYPVFWKEISSEMLERRSISELNLETGTEIDEPEIVTPGGEELSGRKELNQAGFYETSRGTVAVNLLSSDESLRDEVETVSMTSSGEESEIPLKNWLIVLLVVLSLGEIGYLYRIGDFR